MHAAPHGDWLADRFGERGCFRPASPGWVARRPRGGRSRRLLDARVLLGAASAAGSSVNSASGRAVMHWFAVEERGLALGLRQASLCRWAAHGCSDPASDRQRRSRSRRCLPGAGRDLHRRCGGRGDRAPRPSREAAKMVEAVPWTMRDRRFWVLSGGERASTHGAGCATPASSCSSCTTRAGLSNGEGLPLVLAVAQVLAVGLRVAAGRWSDRVRAPRPAAQARRARDLRIGRGVCRALWSSPCGAAFRRSSWAPALSMTWNGLSFTAAAELAGSARSGAALGFQQTTLSSSACWRRRLRTLRG